MRTRKISAKLIAAFAFILAIVIIISCFSYASIRSINRADRLLYAENTLKTEAISDISSNYLRQCLCLFDMAYRDSEAVLDAKVELAELESQMSDATARYAALDANDYDTLGFTDFMAYYEGDFTASKQSIQSALGRNMKPLAQSTLTRLYEEDDAYVQQLLTSAEATALHAQEVAGDNALLFQRSERILLALLIVSVLALLLTAAYLHARIVRPIEKIAYAAGQIALGNTGLALDSRYDGEDEIGVLQKSLRQIVLDISEQSALLRTISEGDFSVSTQARNEQDVLNRAIFEMCDKLSMLIANISQSTEQVASGIVEVSEASQIAAQSSTEQSSAIEELSSSIYEISLNARDNARKAQASSELYQNIRTGLSHGMDAMAEIQEASSVIRDSIIGISNVLSVINSIATQTNIISLNAAVEAANAGEYGKSFAVVAEEIRELAIRAGEAAKSTREMIEESMAKVTRGAEISATTGRELTHVIQEILETSHMIDAIAQASAEQTLGIDQINIAIEHIAKIVSMNSMNAERSATAAEEIAEQAESLSKMVSQFKTKALAAAPAQKLRIPDTQPVYQRRAMKPKPVINLDDDYGKY